MRKNYSLVLGVPKTTLRFNDSLEGLRELRKAVILMYYSYSGKIWIKMRRRENAHRVESRKDQVQGSRCPLSVES